MMVILAKGIIRKGVQWQSQVYMKTTFYDMYNCHGCIHVQWVAVAVPTTTTSATYQPLELILW